MSFSSNRMSSFTEFATKLDWCKCSLNNGIMESDQGDKWLQWQDHEWSIHLMLNNKFATEV